MFLFDTRRTRWDCTRMSKRMAVRNVKRATRMKLSQMAAEETARLQVRVTVSDLIRRALEQFTGTQTTTSGR